MHWKKAVEEGDQTPKKKVAPNLKQNQFRASLMANVRATMKPRDDFVSVIYLGSVIEMRCSLSWRLNCFIWDCFIWDCLIRDCLSWDCLSWDCLNWQGLRVARLDICQFGLECQTAGDLYSVVWHCAYALIASLERIEQGFVDLLFVPTLQFQDTSQL